MKFPPSLTASFHFSWNLMQRLYDSGALSATTAVMEQMYSKAHLHCPTVSVCNNVPMSARILSKEIMNSLLLTQNGGFVVCDQWMYIASIWPLWRFPALYFQAARKTFSMICSCDVLPEFLHLCILSPCKIQCMNTFSPCRNASLRIHFMIQF